MKFLWAAPNGEIIVSMEPLEHGIECAILVVTTDVGNVYLVDINAAENQQQKMNPQDLNNP